MGFLRSILCLLLERWMSGVWSMERGAWASLRGLLFEFTMWRLEVRGMDCMNRVLFEFLVEG